jgi:hypothetical protein
METKPREPGTPRLCVECGQEFIFTFGEQTYFKQKGLAEPKRCKKCRELRKRVDGIFGSRVVIVDSETDLILCNKCRNNASRTCSLAAKEPVCSPCAKHGPTLDADLLTYQDWKTRKAVNPYAG